MKLFLYFIIFLSIFSSCSDLPDELLDDGVSIELATFRKKQIKSIHYALAFDMPSNKNEVVKGSLMLHFDLIQLDQDVILDFKNASDTTIFELTVNGQMQTPDIQKGHLILDIDYLQKGQNTIEIAFEAGNKALNRNEDYMYTLFVPDRAATVFPCFNQPDLKATYDLTLTVAKDWEALSSAPVQKVTENDSTKTLTFKKSDLMSTYLFSFVAGRFDRVSKTINDMEMSALYRPEDNELMTSNADYLFEAHFKAIRWMEEYTQIKMPFQKLDFVLIPGFQFGGMEHVGAIQYRSESLILDKSATLNQRLKRTGVITHEVAHMWFGNLVTMKWFDDVWMKEVFANLMADKMIKEEYQNIDHDLQFLFGHFPSAYDIDRTAGANPIKQVLPNQSEASSLYGSIIYHKAPIVMRQLELLMTEGLFRQGIREYLEQYANRNANWEDLLVVFDRISDLDLKVWNEAWIYSPGRPTVKLTEKSIGQKKEYTLIQTDMNGNGKIWPQQIILKKDYLNGNIDTPLMLDRQAIALFDEKSMADIRFIQLNSSGMGYGVFGQGLEYVRNDFLFNKSRVDISEIDNDLNRGASMINLHEFLLENQFHPQMYFTFLEIYFKSEKNELILKYLLDNIQLVFERFLTKELRDQNIQNLEFHIWNKLLETKDSSVKSLLFNRYIEICYSSEAIARLKELWQGENVPMGLNISLLQKEKIANHIVFKGNEGDSIYFDKQLETMTNPDRINRMKFIKPSLSKDQAVLDAFFESLKYPKNRIQETWVITALQYLHHPYRDESSIRFISPSLEMIEEIHKTGDIFLLKSWLDATLSGYQSKEAVELVESYLAVHPNLKNQLKMKLLQSADMLYRAKENHIYYSQL